MTTMLLEKLLPVASFTIGLGGLVRLFRPAGKTKEVVIATVIASLTLLSGITVYQVYRHEQGVKAVSQEILVLLGDDVKAFDQLYEALYYVEVRVINEALDDLIAHGKVGHKLLELRDYQGATFRVRGYYAKSPPSQHQQPAAHVPRR